MGVSSELGKLSHGTGIALWELLIGSCNIDVNSVGFNRKITLKSCASQVNIITMKDIIFTSHLKDDS